jgi:UDP-N-acetylmuramate--alanine ligase
MKKLVVGVIMGGRSIEREVSFNSGRTICDHLDTACYDIIPIFQTAEGDLFILPWHFLHRGKTTDFVHRLASQAKKIFWDDLKNLVDFIYIAVHGRYAEDGTLQGMLEILQIPYLGSKVFASAARIDKHIHKKLLRMHDIQTPNWIFFPPGKIQKSAPEFFIEELTRTGISFPCICKPQKEGSSLGVQRINNINELLPALEKASWADPRQPQGVIIEELISGTEFTCIILTDLKTGELFALPPTEIVPEANTHIFDYDQKYMPGRATKITPARLSEKQIQKIQQASIKTMQALEITNIARIDGFLTHDDRVIIIDPNSLSGTDPASFLFRQAAEIGISHTQVINHLIQTELKAYDMNLVSEQTTTAEQEHQKIRVAVLLGGSSNEREISLESGRNVVYKLSPHKYEAIPIFVSPSWELFKLDQRLLVRHSTQEILEGVTHDMKILWNDLPTIADFVFIGLHGGSGENGAVQGALEMLKMPYNGPGVFTSALCMDKFKTKQFLKAEGFCVPEGTLITAQEWDTTDNKNFLLKKFLESCVFPCIVKPHDDGCSVLVHCVNSLEELHNACLNIFAAGKSGALIEEYVHGMELTVGVVGNEDPQALPPSRTVAAQGFLSIEEKFLPGAGENQTPAPLAPEDLVLVRRTMEDVYRAIGARGYVRIDCFFQPAQPEQNKSARVVILEINTLPALTPATCLFHQAAEIGIRPMDFIDLIIQFGFEEHTKYTHSSLSPLPSIHPAWP